MSTKKADADSDYVLLNQTICELQGSRFYIMKSCIDTIGARYRYKKDGAYYLCYKEPPVFQKEHTTAAIDKRMARFEEWLSNQEWKPKVITLCRSAISGYLPSDYSQYVEEQLLECLERIYSIKKEKIERKSGDDSTGEKWRSCNKTDRNTAIKREDRYDIVQCCKKRYGSI